MIGIRIGNLRVEDIEEQLKIKFTEEERDYLNSTCQEDVSIDLDAERWHFYDLPRVLVFGSRKSHARFKEILSNHKISGSIQTEFLMTKEDEPASYYQLTTESGYPRFLFATKKYKPLDSFNDYSYYQLVKENKKTLVYKQVKTKRFEKEVLGMTEFILNDILVPDEDEFCYCDIKLDKSVIESPTHDNVIYAGKVYQYSDDDVMILKIWNGELHRNYTKREPISKFTNAIEKYRLHLKNLKKRGNK